MRKSKIITSAVVFVALLVSICAFTSVLNNYKEQNKNTIKSLQLVKSLGKSNFTVKDYENILNTYESLNDTAICGELSSKIIYGKTAKKIMR